MLVSMMQSTKNTLLGVRAGALPAALFSIKLRPEAVPLPRRWARAKAWSRARAAGPPNVEHIKLMLQAERANRG
jgi:hypothetical protein